MIQEPVSMYLEFKDTITSKIEFLELRALAFQKVRSFFYHRDYVEVDTPSIVKSPAIDQHIDSFEVEKQYYLHTSPEYLMKRLLAQGMKKIFYLGHVFRIDEVGSKHNPEFTMIEWYQVSLSMDDLINETLDLCKSFLGDKITKYLSYREAFHTFLDIDPFTANKEDLKVCAKEKGLNFESDLNKDGWLQLLFSHLIEPCFENDTYYVISQYPKSQAALAKTEHINGFEVANRFEIYYNKIELANGYFELNNSQEQIKRFQEENEKRISIGKKPYPLDNKFIQSINNLPECSGVSVGFDRLLMLSYKKENIKDVLCFSFDEL